MKNTFVFFFVLIINLSNAQVSDFKTIDFTIADNRAKLYKGSTLNNLPLLAHKLTNNLPSEAEKFRAIYTWVCNNITGDIQQHNKVKRKRNKYRNDSIAYIKWNDKYKKTAFKKLLKYKATMCTGYAYLIKELCFLANIESKIVNGYGRTTTSNVTSLERANHSWNAVKLNNKWYLCDATWSSGYMVADYLFVNDYNKGYFLTDPILFAQSHYPLDKKWLLNSALINSKFVASPLVYGETFEHKIITISPNKMDITTVKDDEVNFSFKTLKTVSNDNVSLIEFAGANQKSFAIYDLKNDNGLISFKHRFKDKGFYDVHLKIDSDIVATYTFEVTKS